MKALGVHTFDISVGFMGSLFAKGSTSVGQTIWGQRPIWLYLSLNLII